MRRALLTLPALAAALSFTPDAGAYCRTTTAPVPPSYDPTVLGCITDGVPIAWPSMPVTYELHRAASMYVTLAEAAPIFDAAFAAWREVSCSAGGVSGHPSLSFETLAPTDAEYVNCAPDAEACQQAEAHGPHQILFRDDAWPYDDPTATIALTTVTFGLDTGHILSANMEINSYKFPHLATVDPPPAGEISLAAIARHEAGHFIGLAHSQHETAAMYAFYAPNMTSLTQDDIDGVCAAYPPSSGCSCSASGLPGGAPACGALAVGLAAVALRRRRRRVRLRASSLRPWASAPGCGTPPGGSWPGPGC